MNKIKISITMMSLVSFLLVPFSISCSNSIVEPNVIEITIKNRETGQEQLVTNKDYLRKIVTIINSTKKSFHVFMPQKEMTLKYNNKKKITILISNDGHYLIIDGKSYESSYGLCF